MPSSAIVLSEFREHMISPALYSRQNAGVLVSNIPASADTQSTSNRDVEFGGCCSRRVYVMVSKLSSFQGV